MDLYVDDLDRLAVLPHTIDTLVDHGAQVTAYARTHVCDAAPFEPSPVCVLRPLAGAMRQAAEAFAEVEARWRAEWDDLRSGVEGARTELLRAEEAVEHRAAELLAAVRGVAS